MIAGIQALGGDGQAYKRERARAAKAIVAEVYSPPRVTAAARRLPRYGLEPGLALDIAVDDETGRPYDFNRREQRQKAEAKIDARRPLLLIGSPMCTAFSAIQAINRERRDLRWSLVNLLQAAYTWNGVVISIANKFLVAHIFCMNTLRGQRRGTSLVFFACSR